MCKRSAIVSSFNPEEIAQIVEVVRRCVASCGHVNRGTLALTVCEFFEGGARDPDLIRDAVQRIYGGPRNVVAHLDFTVPTPLPN